MALTPAQNATLKTWLQANAAAMDDQQAAAALNADATPAFIVWRSNVTSDEIGNAWLGTDIDGMSSLNMQRLQLLLASSSAGTYNMSRADRRAGFENPFGANASNGSRVAMRAAWKRSASVAEKLFATGTGSDATPAVMAFEGSISAQDVIDSLNS